MEATVLLFGGRGDFPVEFKPDFSFGGKGRLCRDFAVEFKQDKLKLLIAAPISLGGAMLGNRV